jgi:hypothetical protein
VTAKKTLSFLGAVLAVLFGTPLFSVRALYLFRSWRAFAVLLWVLSFLSFVTVDRNFEF